MGKALSGKLSCPCDRYCFNKKYWRISDITVLSFNEPMSLILNNQAQNFIHAEAQSLPSFLFAADLEKQLLESERLLGEISVVSRQETPNIASMARNMEAMERTTDEMEIELRR